MIKVPYIEGRAYDPLLEKIAKGAFSHIDKNDDDIFWLIVGKRGRGKSTIALHLLEGNVPEERLKSDLLSHSVNQFADQLDVVADGPKPRMICYDEANVSKREALTKANRRILDLYFKIRGMNIFHIWCNPSLDMIDKPFIKEIVNGIIYVSHVQPPTSKHPRYYYYFKQADVLKIYEEFGKLDLDVFKQVKVRKRYCYFRGWFHDYQGVLKEEYSSLKKARMLDEIKRFKKDFGTTQEALADVDSEGRGLMSTGQLAKIVGRHPQSIRNYCKAGIFKENEHFIYSMSGLRRFKPVAIDYFASLGRRQPSVMKNGIRDGGLESKRKKEGGG